MNFSDYTSIDAVNFSTLRHIGKSPAHYRAAAGRSGRDTPSLMLGRAVHLAVLEPDRFAAEVAAFAGDKRKRGEWVAFQESNAGKIVLGADDHLRCVKIAAAVHRHPTAGRILSCGDAERVIEWTDPETGIRCKGRLDWSAKNITADLKTASTATEMEFGSAAARYDYHVQAAWYRWGRSVADGCARLPFSLIAAEKDDPFVVAVYDLPTEALAAGEERFRLWLRQLAACIERDEWPGPADGDLWLPAWVFAGGSAEPLEDVA